MTLFNASREVLRHIGCADVGSLALWVFYSALRCLFGVKNGANLVLEVDAGQTCLKSIGLRREIAFVRVCCLTQLESVDSCHSFPWLEI